MKLKKLLVITLTGFMMMSAKAQERVTKFYVSSPKIVSSPVFIGDKEELNQTFTVNNMQNLHVDLFEDNKNFTLMSTDTAGVLNLKKVEGKNAFYLVKTRIRADRFFMYGNMKITSPARWQVYMNGYSMGMKGSAEDSITDASIRNVAFAADAEATYDVVFKVFSSEEDKLAPTLKVEIENTNPEDNTHLYIGTDIKNRLSIYETMYNKRVTSVALSPSGKYLLTRFTYKYENGKGKSFYEVSNVKTGKVLIKDTKEGISWMPKSDKLCYNALGDNGTDIIAVDPETREETIIAKNIPDAGYDWSPNEQYIFYYPVEDIQPENKGDLIRFKTPQSRVQKSEAISYLERYNIKEKVSERIAVDPKGISTLDVSDDGSRILCIHSKENLSKRPFYLSMIYEIDFNKKKVDTIVYESVYSIRAIYSPDEKKIVVTSSPDSFDKIGKANNAKISNDYDTQAFIIDLATKEIEPITKNFDPKVSIMTWNRIDNCIYFKATEKDFENMYKYNVANKTFTKLNLEVDAVERFSIASYNPSVVAYTGQSDNYSGAAYLLDNKANKTIRVVADPMKETYANMELGEVKQWTFTASDGTVIDGRICLPPNFDPNKKYPMIVYYYGGTTPSTKGISSPYCPQLFASQNYVVYVIQPSGTIGYGQEFSARHVNAWGKRTAEDIIEGTKLVCKAHPFINDKKIGCIGASYGGFMTQYLQTQTDIFAAAVSHAGISNITSYWGEGYWGYLYNAVAAADSYPWNNPELYTKQGSLFNADKINTPLLLLHGLSDTNVPIGESIQLFNALKLLGKTVEFIGVKGEDHFISDPKRRIEWHKRIMAWFAKYLQDSPDAWENLYPTEEE